MPFCPNCKQEYEQGIARCADCDVALVEKLGATSAPEGAGEGPAGEARAAAVFRGESPQVVDLMRRAVAMYQIPTEVVDRLPGSEEKGSFLVVPQEMGEQAARVLEGLSALVVEGEGEQRLIRFYDPQRDEEIRDPELLKESTADLVERGEDLLDPLIEIVTRGDAASRHRAAYVLSCMGRTGMSALVQLLKGAIEREREEVAVGLIRVMRDEIDPGFGMEEICSFLSASPVSKRLALHALASLGTLDVFPRVLPLLEDADPAVRDEADNALCTLSDEDMGFDAEAPEEERRKSIDRWRAWWEGRRNG